MQVEVIATIDVQDVSVLHDRAASGYCLRHNGEASAFDFAQETMGTVDAPDVGGCLRDLVQTALPADAGFVVGEVSTRAAGLLRTIPMVGASISNLSIAEMERIRMAFGMKPEGETYLVLEDVRHDGLWLSPKDHGFYVRLPALAETWDEVLPGLTPEMRAIVTLARAQGADRIEFDADEDATEGLVDFYA
jgi:hypothetical protein